MSWPDAFVVVSIFGITAWFLVSIAKAASSSGSRVVTYKAKCSCGAEIRTQSTSMGTLWASDHRGHGLKEEWISAG